LRGDSHVSRSRVPQRQSQWRHRVPMHIATLYNSESETWPSVQIKDIQRNPFRIDINTISYRRWIWGVWRVWLQHGLYRKPRSSTTITGRAKIATLNWRRFRNWWCGASRKTSFLGVRESIEDDHRWSQCIDKMQGEVLWGNARATKWKETGSGRGSSASSACFSCFQLFWLCSSFPWKELRKVKLDHN